MFHDMYTHTHTHSLLYCPSLSLSLIQGYTAHFGKLLEYQFPLLYNETLHLIIDGKREYHCINILYTCIYCSSLVLGTDTGGISSHCWQELSSVTTPTSSVDSDTCRLGLQLLQESMQYLSSFYTQKRLYTKVCAHFLSLPSHFLSLSFLIIFNICHLIGNYI